MPAKPYTPSKPIAFGAGKGAGRAAISICDTGKRKRN
jgi:hypothetical protein